MEKKLTPETARNHQRHADNAAEELRKKIKYDMERQQSNNGSDGNKFQFFIAFAYEVMDRYVRFLSYIDRKKSKEEWETDNITYNEIMLQKGLACPVYPPDKFNEIINEDNKLSRARKFVRDAREKHIGIFESNDPLKLMAFELRYLFRRNAPDRFVIDMSSSNPVLLKPTEYWRISNEEDRLFVDEHFVSLFQKIGYPVQG